jgi:hypothetical protein
LPIADCRLPIADFQSNSGQSATENQQLTINNQQSTHWQSAIGNTSIPFRESGW